MDQLNEWAMRQNRKPKSAILGPRPKSYLPQKTHHH